MTDFLLLDRLGELIRKMERPRLLYRKGVAAEGYFRPYVSWSDYTKAGILSDPEEVTPVAARFSSMTGDRGTPDTARGIKGLAVKFSGRREQWDLICQSLPVFFINREKKFPELRDAMTVRESFDRIHRERFWKFVTDNPESVNCAVRLFSWQGIRDSFVDITWYSVNTYVWENKEGKRFLVRYKWKPILSGREKTGRKTDRIRAEFMAGFDPDRCEEELRDRMERGIFPSFELQVQIRRWSEDEEEVKRTLHWEEELYTPLPAGVMKLTKILRPEEGGEENMFFLPGRTAEGMGIYEDEFSRVMDYAHKAGALERGGKP